MAKLYTAADMQLINQFAAAMMPAADPHVPDAVLAVRLRAAFRAARVAMEVSKETAALEAPRKPTKKDSE